MARKLLSLVVALAVVLSSMSFAFAAADPKAVSADVTDAKVKTAVEKLVAFGMVEGIDGKYVPDQKLKRSELTKLIVIALGLGPAADAAMGATQFSDVGADHWASGYITVAAGQGLVQGMGDGTFSPDTEITFAQALTILVRALGYKDEFLKGVWPGNYLAKASEKGIYAGISITPGAAVKRGDFAVMMSNTLDAKIVSVGEYKDGGVTYIESPNTTLLKDKFKLDKIEVRPTKNVRLGDQGIDKVEVRFKKSYVNNSDVDAAVQKALNADVAYDLTSGMSVDSILGVSCYAYYSKDVQKIVYFEESGASTVYWDGIDKFVGSTDSDANTTDIVLRWAGKQFTVKEGDKNFADGTDPATIWVTKGAEPTQWTGAAKYTSAVAKQDFGRFVVESNKIVFADLYRYESANAGMMTKSVDEASKTLTYIDSSASETSLNLGSAYSSFTTYLVDTKTAAVTSIGLKDIKPFDVVYLAKALVDQKYVATMFVFRNTQTGVFTSITQDGGKMEFDSKSDSLKDFGDIVTFSKDNNDTYKLSSASTKSTLRAGELNDFYNQKVTAIIDNNKKIRHLYGESVNSSDMYGIIRGLGDSVTNSIKIYTINDETVTYFPEDDTKILESEITTGNGVGFTSLSDFYTANNASSDFTLIKYKINKDGKIAKNSVTAYAVDTQYRNNISGALGNPLPGTKDNARYVTINGNFGTDSLVGSGNVFYVDSEVKIFNVSGTNVTAAGITAPTELKISKWDSFKNKEVTGTGTNILAITEVVSTGAAQSQTIKMFVVMDQNINNITVDQRAAYIINYATEDGTQKVFYKLYGGDGATLKGEWDSINSVSQSAMPKESAAIVNLTSTGKVAVYANAYAANYGPNGSGKPNYSTVAGLVYKKEGNYIYINSSDTKYLVASDALIYSEKDKKTVSDIMDGKHPVIAIMKNGQIVSMEVVMAESMRPNTANAAGITYGQLGTSSGVYTAGTDYKAYFLSGFNNGINNTNLTGGYYTTSGSFAAGDAVRAWGSVENKAIAVTK